MNNWTGNIDFGLEKHDETQYKIVLVVSANAAFKITQSATSWNVATYSYNNVEEGCRNLVSRGDNDNIVFINGGTYTIYFKPGTHSMWINKEA